MSTPLLTLGFLPNLGMPELIFVLIIVLIIFGPKSLPTLGRALGQGVREFKDGANKFSEALSDAEKDEKRNEESRRREAKAITHEATPASVPPAPADTVPASSGNSDPDKNS